MAHGKTPPLFVPLIALFCLSAFFLPGQAEEEASATGTEAALRFIAKQQPPVFRENHSLPPLGHWRQIPPEVTRRFADDWGYALYLGRISPELIENLDRPESEEGRMLEWVRAEPERYALQLLVHPAASSRTYLDQLPREAFLLNEEGEYILGERTRLLSPAAPDEAFAFVGDYEARLVREIQARHPIDLITHGAEFGFNAAGHNQENYEQDPRVMERKGERDWMTYLSDERGRMERIVRSAVKAEAPESLYILYKETAGGHPQRKRWGGWWRWGFLYREGASDLASPSLYWSEDSFTFDLRRGDLLTHLLNARAQEIDAGAEYAYPWLSGGWVNRGFADNERYTGWVKCVYVSGALGAVAGYFGNTPTDDPVEKSLPAFLALGHVHALFSHLDDFLRHSELLPGPDPHVFSDDLPAYEFPTGDENKRVLARRHREENQWLLVAWAGDGETAEVAVAIPDLGEVTVTAHPAGHVYQIDLDAENQPRLDLLDPDPMDPTGRWR